MSKSPSSPKWLRSLVSLIFDYRYLISLIMVFGIIGLGLFLYNSKDWPAKDAAQVCTGFFLVLTLFFTALNFEFSTSKMKQDYKAARELLTYNTASEWHKTPLTEYQKITIKHEKLFAASATVRTAKDFNDYLDDPQNLEFRESLKGILNAFETLSIGVYKGLIDKEFMKDFYKSIFKIYYIDYLFYIDGRRIAQSNGNTWLNYTNLVEDWFPGIRDEMQKKPLKSSIITF